MTRLLNQDPKPKNASLRSCNAQAFSDGQILALSANLKGAEARLNNLLKYIKTLPRPPDIVNIQDPPRHLAYTKGLFPYEPFYWVEGEDMTERDNPYRRDYRAPYGRKSVQSQETNTMTIKFLDKVAFLVHRSILNPRVSRPSGPNNRLVATMAIETRNQTLLFHNVYNHLSSLNIKDFWDSIPRDPSSSNILVGDFNLRHRDWEGDSMPASRSTTEANQFAECIHDADMILLNERGVATYSRARQGLYPQWETVLDLLIVDGKMEDFVSYELLQGVEGFDSDHRITRFAIDVDIERPNKPHHVWRLLDREKFKKAVHKKCKELWPDDALPELSDEKSAVEMLRAFRDNVMLTCIDEHVPVTETFHPVKRLPQ